MIFLTSIRTCDKVHGIGRSLDEWERHCVQIQRICDSVESMKEEKVETAGAGAKREALFIPHLPRYMIESS